MKKSNKPVEYSEKDYEFMNSLSAAILNKTPQKISKVLRIWLITIILFLIWATLAEIDEITRGDGDVIPYGQNQIIQNLEGGIIESILVEEGQKVKIGETILKINNAKSTSSSLTNSMKYQELEAKKLRLYAQANELDFQTLQTDDTIMKKQIELSKELYYSNKKEFLAKDRSIVNQIEQKKQEYKEAKARIKTLQRSLEFVIEEIAMTAPMVREGIKSKVDFLKLKREANGIENDIEASSLSLPRLKYS
ncbi:MAG: HlyD family type I secretion periplasmic adaptor subunit, partial [Campylobacterota bacterium]|nr:HlyD family type I secretion periplasmic adaptor subunit [Campylobacterota bacterium]